MLPNVVFRGEGDGDVLYIRWLRYVLVVSCTVRSCGKMLSVGKVSALTCRC